MNTVSQGLRLEAVHPARQAPGGSLQLELPLSCSISSFRLLNTALQASSAPGDRGAAVGPTLPRLLQVLEPSGHTDRSHGKSSLTFSAGQLHLRPTDGAGLRRPSTLLTWFSESKPSLVSN